MFEDSKLEIGKKQQVGIFSLLWLTHTEGSVRTPAVSSHVSSTTATTNSTRWTRRRRAKLFGAINHPQRSQPGQDDVNMADDLFGISSSNASHGRTGAHHLSNPLRRNSTTIPTLQYLPHFYDSRKTATHRKQQ